MEIPHTKPDPIQICCCRVSNSVWWRMTRSEEALQRRAKKRNLSVENMKQVEASSWNKKPKIESTIQPSIPTPQPPSSAAIRKPVIVALNVTTSDRWICNACNNNNLSRISATQCNRCQRLRSESVPNSQESVAPQTRSESSSQSVRETEIKKTTRTDKTPVKEQIARKKIDPKKDKLPAVWSCPPATQSLIDENMKLRKLYEDSETRSQLSPEELERARILVERSERKKQKKEKRSKARGSSAVAARAAAKGTRRA
jgi:hypothetical protein